MKKIPVLVTAFFFAQLTLAQPSIQWQKALGGNGFESLLDVRPSGGEGYIFVGQSNAADGDVTGPIKGLNDIWIVKTDNAGVIDWDTSFGGPQGEGAWNIWPAPGGGFVVMGLLQSASGDINCNHGYSDIFVMKISSNGAISWAQCYGGTQSDMPHSMTATADGNFVISGSTVSNDGDVSGNHGASDIWLAKISAANGNIIWQRCYGGTASEGYADIEATSDGGLVFAGTSSSNNGDVGGNKGLSDIWVVKTDSVGNIIWEQNIGGTKNDIAWAITETKDGGFAVAGRTQSNDGDIASYIDSFDAVVVRLSPNGNVQWANALGGIRDDNAVDVLQLADSNLLVLGITNSTDGDITVAGKGDADLWLFVLDQSGTIQSQMLAGGSKGENAFKMQRVSDSTYMVLGGTLSSDGDVTGFHTGSAPTYADAWILNIKVPLQGVGVKEIPSLPVAQVYPTVTNSIVNIKFEKQPQNTTLLITDIAGRPMQTAKATSTLEQLDISNYPAGNYLLTVAGDDGKKVFRLTKI